MKVPTSMWRVSVRVRRTLASGRWSERALNELDPVSTTAAVMAVEGQQQLPVMGDSAASSGCCPHSTSRRWPARQSGYDI